MFVFRPHRGEVVAGLFEMIASLPSDLFESSGPVWTGVLLPDDDEHPQIEQVIDLRIPSRLRQPQVVGFYLRAEMRFQIVQTSS